MIALAKPTLDMFAELSKSAYSMLTVSFNYYRFTDEYRYDLRFTASRCVPVKLHQFWLHYPCTDKYGHFFSQITAVHSSLFSLSDDVSPDDLLVNCLFCVFKLPVLFF